MKIEKYYCDICYQELIYNEVENMKIAGKKYDLCHECKRELQIRTLDYLKEMKEKLKRGDKNV